jgi:hypothetical protein
MPKLTTATGSTQFVILDMAGGKINETAPLRDRTLTEFEEYAVSALEVAHRINPSVGLVIQWYIPHADAVIAHAGYGYGGVLQLVVDDPSFRD